ncbi:MAG: tandem-95 repeat protein, partial [Candidatus Marinimicrobia bacterium]|nr:tandem-95 repeat protein [Candidatus Neomarinimicrobiota bacterium]
MKPGLALARMMALMAAVSVVTAGGLPTYPPNTTQALAARLLDQRSRQQLELRALVSPEEMGLRLLSSGRVAQLQRLAGRRPIYYITDNLNAARTVATQRLWSGGGLGLALTGGGVTVAVWDGGGVLASHQEFGGRVTRMDATLPVIDHATHVAGTIAAAGIDNAAHGMAGNVQVISYDWENDAAEMATAAAEGLVLSNHSYSIAAGWEWDWRGDDQWAWFGDPTIDANEDWIFGFYLQESADWDQIAATAPDYLIVTSAGNDRDDAGPGPGPVEHWAWDGVGWVWVLAERDPDGNYDSLPGGAGSAKNVLVVGAVEDLPGGYQDSAGVLMTAYSSWGPTDDGRIKPDLVANGTTLYSTMALDGAAYDTLSGTSMAAPAVTGSLALLQEHYRATHGGAQPRSATLRALVVHTADEAGDAPGPDYRFGWGLLNTAAAAAVISMDTLDNRRLQELVLADGGEVTLTVSSDGWAPLKVTLAWTDPPGTVPIAAVDPLDLMLVNDLDVTLTNLATGQVNFPWVLDGDNPSLPAATGINDRDNIEQVMLAAPIPGDYLVTIDHKGILVNGAQQFSLVVTGATFPVLPRVLVWDGDSTADDYSGRFIRDLLQAGDTIEVDYRTTLPADLSGYDAAFLSFGNSGASKGNTPFTGELAAIVQAYLAGGGRLYLEGGDALAQVALDAAGKDSLWNMLGIGSVADGRFNQLDSLIGQLGTLTEGMLFTASNQFGTQYIDLYFPGTGLAAFQETDYGVVAVQQANEYGSRSFVFSYALAALVDDTPPSTRAELLRRIYDFLLEQAPTPTITAISPEAIWRGRRTLVNLYGENLAEVTAISVDQPAVVENPPVIGAGGDQASVWLTIAAETAADSVTITAQAPGGSAAIALRLDYAPQAVDDTAATPEDSTIVLAVLLNDRHPPGDPLQISAVSSAVYGSVTWQPGDTTIRYSPPADYFGPDSFTYTAVDTGGATTQASVWLTVLSVNDPPLFTSPSVAPAIQDQWFVYRATATDADNDSLVFYFYNLLSWLTATDGDTVMGTPSPDDSGGVFLVTAWDGQLYDSLEVTVTVTPVNHRPTARDDVAVTLEDSAVVVPVLVNDSDPDDGDTLRVILLGPGRQGGVVAAAGDTALSYRPPADYFGLDTVAYAVQDTEGAADTALVFITIQPVNDPPGPFTLLTPVSVFEIEFTSDNLDDTLQFTWEPALDVDGDSVHYSLWVTPALAGVLAVEPGSDTNFIRLYSGLAAAALATAERLRWGSWTI